MRILILIAGLALGAVSQYHDHPTPTVDCNASLNHFDLERTCEVARNGVDIDCVHDINIVVTCYVY